MRKPAMILLLMCFSSLLVAQNASSHASAARPASSRQSTIQGCETGSDVQVVVTDEHTGKVYVLHGNDSLLKQNVGHEVIVTGIATPSRPSDKKGSIHLEVNHIQAIADTCARQSEPANTIAASQAALGSVTINPNATEPHVGYQAQAPQQGPAQSGSLSSTPSNPSVAIAGKTGNRGDTFPVTTTGSTGQVTPGVETQAGVAQSPGQHTGTVKNEIKPVPQTGAAPGAPPAPEQTAQNPIAAERIASSAQRAEVNNSQHQLGVNAQPNYNQSAQQQTARADQAVAGYEHQQAPPTLVGCLVNSDGGARHGYYLQEQKSGLRYRLNAAPAQLKEHINHLVEIVGRPGDREGTSKSVAGANQAVFEVTGVQDLAPTCGASVRR
ncbi:MAG TPA: hypothetical protein VFI82_16905 [Terriglobales bacterium]|nr:hypothetical protein [Terriglobales bacterium]